MKLLLFLLQLFRQTHDFFIFFGYLLRVQLTNLLQFEKLLCDCIYFCVSFTQLLVKCFNLSFLVEIQVSQALYFFFEYFCVYFV